MEFGYATARQNMDPPGMDQLRRILSFILILAGVGIMIMTYSCHGNPVFHLLIGFFIAPLILLFLGLGWDGLRLVLLSSVAVVLAAFLLPVVYQGILSPLSILGHSEANFVIMACILAPIFEELVKGSLWILERGSWKQGAAIGLGFGCFEATSYLMVYGFDIAFLRWQGTILHVVATALMFQGLSMKQGKFVVVSILLHIAHNSVRILIGVIL